MSYMKSKKSVKLADALKQSSKPSAAETRAAQKKAKAGGAMGYLAKKC